MPDFQDLADIHGLASEYQQHVLDHWSKVTRILIVVDGTISATPGRGFNLGRVIAELRGFKAGLARIEVDTATRNGAAEYQTIPGRGGFNHFGFRFDQGGTDQILNHYDQLWLFGHWPGNFGNQEIENEPDSLDPALNQIITHPSFNPLSSSELTAIVRWMNGGGGLFATGDHHLLGASMCFAIPRVNTMRRWRLGDGLPTFSGPTRFDTNQAATPEQRAGEERINDFVEEDAIPQPIEWVAEFGDNGWLLPRKMPHPILCHPALGPIDVLPDHPHEGSCYDVQASGWLSGQAEHIYTIGSLHGRHYPKVGDFRPLPKTIAWGRTPESPPLRYNKGPQPFRRVPLINVYDGQQIEIGRVVVDSTWHHWFDMNLNGLAESEDQRSYQKIARYHVNVAIWLAQPGFRSAMTLGGLKAGEFDYFGAEGVELNGDSAMLGMSVLQFLAPTIGPCWVVDLADEAIAQIYRQQPLRQVHGKRPALTRPPQDYIHAVVLGELVKEVYSDLPEALAELAKTGHIRAPRHLPTEPFDLAVTAARRGLAQVADLWREDIATSTNELAAIRKSLDRETKSKGR